MKVPNFPTPPSPLNLSIIYPSTIQVTDHNDIPSQRIDLFYKFLHYKKTNLVSPSTSSSNCIDDKAKNLAEIKLKMIGHNENENDGNNNNEEDEEDDDNDVICATPDIGISPKTILPLISIGVQTRREFNGPYRLKVFPTLKDNNTENNDTSTISSKICKHLRFFGRLSLCQFGLIWLLTFWTIAGAFAFYATEGPREREQVFELKILQRNLAIGLATELRQLKANEEEMEPLWSNKVKQYVVKHEKLILAAVNAGYGEGGNVSGQLWTFSGCILFSISLLTMLGFGAPIPRTTMGRTVAVIFAAIGIPAHFLLIFNLGLLLAVCLQKYAFVKKYGSNYDVEAFETFPVPKWVKIMPFIWIASYYILGIMIFGVARSRSISDSLLFPLDFTVSGGLAATSDIVRIMYGLYLEGAVTIAAVAVAVLRVSASQSLTNIGLKYGLLTEAT